MQCALSHIFRLKVVDDFIIMELTTFILWDVWMSIKVLQGIDSCLLFRFIIFRFTSFCNKKKN